MSKPADDPAVTFTKARNGGGKILIMIGDKDTFNPELVEHIERLDFVSQRLYDGIIEQEGRGLAVCLRIHPKASLEEIEDTVSWAAIAIAHEITEHHGWDDHAYFLEPDEILWRRGAPVTTRW